MNVPDDVEEQLILHGKRLHCTLREVANHYVTRCGRRFLGRLVRRGGLLSTMQVVECRQCFPQASPAFGMYEKAFGLLR